MQAKSIKGRTAFNIKAALESTVTEGYKSTLVIVFTPKQREALVDCDQVGEKG